MQFLLFHEESRRAGRFSRVRCIRCSIGTLSNPSNIREIPKSIRNILQLHVEDNDLVFITGFYIFPGFDVLTSRVRCSKSKIPHVVTFEPGARTVLFS